MIIDEFYARNAINLKIKIQGITENNLSDYMMDIISKATQLGIDTTNLIESEIDLDSEIASVFFLQEDEILIHCVNRSEDNYIKSHIGEYIVFNERLAEAFNKEDTFGHKDFEDEDEILIYGISRKYIKDGSIISRYRLDTFIVKDKPIEITLDSNEEEEEKT